ncbi:hypothetical protein [Geobacillus stearothermophilus]|uniref:Uncharacterized protein n=1 Tax=Geobacillus stearothermophilus TaxID=1422 RepID=A0A150MQ02_GEOSE|nr:hypothetical protein [Geobacillus stearothermophilus]KYD26546.1 hypothetical protein B4109_3165 [Geobacillus stearothermophilus]
MPEVNVLNKNLKKEGNKVVVTKTIEENLTRQDLLQAKQNIQYQKQALLQQFEQLKNQMSQLENQEKEIDELLQMLGEDEMTL